MEVGDVLRTSGRPLDSGVRGFMEARLGNDFSRVRVHADSTAAESARSVGAAAYTAGNHIVFGSGRYAPATAAGRAVLAHELAHVAQQGGNVPNGELRMGERGGEMERQADVAAGAVGTAGPPLRIASQDGARGLVQRYEAGEHAKFGETQAQLQAFVDERAMVYEVKTGETLGKIAQKFNIGEEQLKEANKAKLKKWTGIGGGKKVVEGFAAGEKITIPPIINDATREALKSKELEFTVNGVTVEYGVGIAMGDLFKDPAEMQRASATDLGKMAKLISDEKRTGVITSTDDWQAATGNKYVDLATKNESHFAPSDSSLATPTAASGGADNHKTLWERYHGEALGKSQGGDKNEAFRVNAYADHYLTDAFSAGHVINKIDVMEKFKGNLPTDAKGEFIGDAKTFFEGVANTAFVGDVKKLYSQYETADAYFAGWHPNINSADRFSTLLQRIQKKEPNLLANAVAKAVHDSLNTLPGGLEVENQMGDKWQLSGDTTLNAKTTEVGRKAVARSLLNILDVFKSASKLDLPALFKKVWDYVPRPTAAGTKVVSEKVSSGTSPKDRSLIGAVVALVNANYKLILNELVSRGYLKKA